MHKQNYSDEMYPGQLIVVILCG